MATVYPTSGYPPYGGGGPNTNQNPPLAYGNQAGGYPLQGGGGYAPSSYAPPGGAYPGAPYQGQQHTIQPIQPFIMPPGGDPGQQNPGYNYMPPQGAYAVPQAYPQYGAPPQGSLPMAIPYPSYNNQGGVAYGAQHVPGSYPGYTNQALMTGGQVPYPIPGQAPPQAVLQYPMAIATQSGPGSDPASQFTMRQWSAGLCGCMDNCIPNCFMPWCCPCVSLAQIYARLGLTTYRIALIRLTLLIASGFAIRFVPAKSSSSSSYSSSRTSSGQIVTGSVWYVVLVGQQLAFIAAIAIARRRVRQRFKIPGNGCSDLVTSCCCSCCSIAQMATHIRSYEPGSCDFTGPDVLPAFL